MVNRPCAGIDWSPVVRMSVPLRSSRYSMSQVPPAGTFFLFPRLNENQARFSGSSTVSASTGTFTFLLMPPMLYRALSSVMSSTCF